MSDEESRGVPDSLKGCAIMLIAAGILVAGVGNGYVAISNKLNSDRDKAEAKQRQLEKSRKEAVEKEKLELAKSPKKWEVLEWDKSHKATLTTRYLNGRCDIKISLEWKRKIKDQPTLMNVKLLDSDGFTIRKLDSDGILDVHWKNFLSESDSDSGPLKEGEIEITQDMSENDYYRIASWSSQANLNSE
jgi:hypothetical protein